MRNTFKALCLAIVLIFSIPRVSYGFWWSTEWTQIANNIELVISYITQFMQFMTQIKMLQDMAVNSVKLPRLIWANSLSNLRQLDQLMANGRSLAYSSSNIEARFAAQYKDYGAFLSQEIGTPDLQTRFVQWSKDNLELSKQTLQAANQQSQQFQGENDALNQLKDMSAHSRGRQASLQVGQQIAVQQVEQLQKLRQLMMTQLNLHAKYMATREEKESVERAEMRKFTKPVHVPINDGERF